tara:strand:- start:176 stop:427 length:252 start_codon:yes stop_codon:yes gene_type:complete
MNRKNLLISVGVIGIGLVLYKLLLGLVLPITLFVGLGYALKFLLKGTESDSVKVISQISSSIESTSSSNDILEIKPVEEKKPD